MQLGCVQAGGYQFVSRVLHPRASLGRQCAAVCSSLNGANGRQAAAQAAAWRRRDDLPAWRRHHGRAFAAGSKPSAPSGPQRLRQLMGSAGDAGPSSSQPSPSPSPSPSPNPSRSTSNDSGLDGGEPSTSGAYSNGTATASVFTLPTMLTLARVAAVPALVAAWFWSSPAAPMVCTVLFVVASLTDWLDGYLARKMNASSPFGAFLDPVADKLMVAATLILLCTQPLAAGPWAGNTWIVPALTLLIIGREITMSALREWAATLGAEARAAVAVNSWGKWKTATQMASLTLLLMTRDGAASPAMAAAAAAGPPLLAVAAWLTVHSLALYLRGLWRFMV